MSCYIKQIFGFGGSCGARAESPEEYYDCLVERDIRFEGGMRIERIAALDARLIGGDQDLYRKSQIRLIERELSREGYAGTWEELLGLMVDPNLKDKFEYK